MAHRWDPEAYHRNSSTQEQWAHELIGKLALAGNERVLDLGCGEGKVTAAIARMVPRGRVVGLDNSPEMIRYALEHYRRPEYGNLAFLRGDMQTVRFFGQFDRVFSNAALHWVDDHRPVLQGIYQALVPGGFALLQMGGKGNISDLTEVVRGLAGTDPWKPYFKGFTRPFRFYGAEEYRALVSGAGLAPVRVELIPKEMVQEDRDRFAGWIRTTWLPILERLPEDLREPFIGAVIDTRSLLSPPDEKGQYHVPMVRLEVEARKDDY